MSAPQINDDLVGRMLIAMPGMGDPRFDKSVVFLCAHTSEGAMGLIVNKPAGDLSFPDLLEQLDITPTAHAEGIRVHFGGPVEHGRGFVLHSDDYASNESTVRVAGGYGMTATLDILHDIARGKGPTECIMALGYAGWGPGQLEAEFQHNGWLAAPADRAIVFGSDNGGKWEAALRLLGIPPSALSAAGGRA
ncbi:MAG: YqgE/AlgH family protein [Rhodobacteraceae bacterium]|nr:YqgE/AlgH family protein [Paracoccaceae bacterium]